MLEGELQASSAIPEVMEWNEISDSECGMKEKRMGAELGKKYQHIRNGERKRSWGWAEKWEENQQGVGSLKQRKERALCAQEGLVKSGKCCSWGK